MVQQGQVMKLKEKGANRQALWAYRYRLEGRGSARPQTGGFASRAEARKALQKVVERLSPAGRGASMHGALPDATYLVACRRSRRHRRRRRRLPAASVAEPELAARTLASCGRK